MNLALRRVSVALNITKNHLFPTYYGIIFLNIFYDVWVQEVDIISIGFSPTADRIVFMDFSTPLIVQPNRLVVPFPKEESRLLATVMPFQSMVRMILLTRL